MSTLEYPSILIDLARAGESGMPLNPSPAFQQELELCRQWGFQLRIADERVSLRFDRDQLVPHWIQRETPAIAWDSLGVNGFLCIGSTNTEALDRAERGVPEGTLIYAEEQTAGKGRKDRAWFSPARSGLYFSLVLRPKQPQKFWPILTHVASVALVDTLKNLSDCTPISHPLDVDIKWPNDVLLSGKKCAGILIETAAAKGGNSAAVVGIGVNVRAGSVPPTLESEATCLDDMIHGSVPRRQLLVSFLHHFQILYLTFERGDHRALLELWRGYSSMWNGIQVWITDGARRRAGVTCGLDENGALLVRTAEGIVETVLAGDISVKRAPQSGNL
jgi:BirA family biotin operon repressor/biotin-[acetyl-CoA-carboxylase] ligase